MIISNYKGTTFDVTKVVQMSIQQLLASVRAYPGVNGADYDERNSTLTLRYSGSSRNMAELEALARRAGARLRVRQAPAATPEDAELAALPWMVRLTVLCLVSVALGWALEGRVAPWVVWVLYAVAYAS